MSANTKIEWADHTFNPWIGCTKVGPGCDNCYAAAWDRRFAQSGHAMHWGAGKKRKRTQTWGDPVRWNKQHAAFFDTHGRRQRVFCASLADVFDNEVPDDWFDDLMRLIRDTPHLDWLLLTKRIGNAIPKLNGYCDRNLWVDSWDKLQRPPKASTLGYQNVWIGATICNQQEADRDIPKLLAVPAAKRFLSMEPLLGPVDLTHWIGLQPAIGATTYRDDEDIYRCDLTGTPVDGIDWVIIGGESGPNARPMHPDWARSLRDQCQAAQVPFLFKQWGEWTPGENVERHRGTVDTAFLWRDEWTIQPLNLATDGGHVDDEPDLYRVGKKAAGRHLDGRTWDEVPV